MGQYDAYLVCKNGHGVNESFYRHPAHNKNFCALCGAQTIMACPSCGHDIQGEYHVDGVISFGSVTPVPDICNNCGKDFPWRSTTKKIKESLQKGNKDSIFLLETIIDRFHLVAKQLRQRYDDRETFDVKDEYDTQDLLHALLRIYFDDVRVEEWNPSYAGGSTRSDFLLKDEKIVIEVKKTRNGLKSKQLGEQLIIDISKYKTHPDCKLLLCFVYDPDSYISNPRGIENDLNNGTSEMKVKVKIVPKGH